MKTHTARWLRNGPSTWILKETIKRGSDILGRIEQTADGWTWADRLGAGERKPMEHELKTFPEYFQAVRSGAKPFELRKEDDRHFEVGDILYLREWEPILSCYTGAAIRVRVTYVLRGGPWLPVGYVAMGVKREEVHDRQAEIGKAAYETHRQDGDWEGVPKAEREHWRAVSRAVMDTVADQQRAELDTLRARTDDCMRLLAEAQTLMRPHGAWEAYTAQIKQAVMDAFDGVDQEQRDGAVFDNPLLAVTSRIALAWMDLDAARAQGEDGV